MGIVLGCILQGPGRLRGVGNNDRRLKFNELKRESVKRRVIASRSTVFKGNVPVVSVAEAPQGLPKCIMVGVAAGDPAQKSYAGNFIRLRVGGDRLRRQAKASR